MKTIFIADLHLDESRPKVTELFFNYLKKLENQKIDALYILGDLFEVWIGDDCKTKLNKIVAEKLANLFKTGVKVYFIHGNRDFLLGNDYAKSCQFEILNEHTVIDLYGTKTLIMHGDTLCTDDIDYVKFRKKVRNQDWKNKMLSAPIFFRKIIAFNMRRKSKKINKNKAKIKTKNIMEVNLQTIENVMAEKKATQLIHGHIHHANISSFSYKNKQMTRFVLADWSNAKGCALEVTNKKIKLIDI